MGERSDLDALEAALDAYEPPPADWTDELWELYERTEAPGPHAPLTQELEHLFATERVRERRVSAVQHLFDSLRRRREEAGLREPARAAGLAERWVRTNAWPLPGVVLLYGLGAPHGEAALLRLAVDDAVEREDRQLVRAWLIKLRRPRNTALGRRPQDGETPLLPPAVRGLADAWGTGDRWPARVTLDRENAAAARAALEALLPARRLPVPEPPPEMTGGRDEGEEERPDWIDVRILLRELMPYPRTVTRERMAALGREAGRMGLESGGEDFAERWTVRIGAWIAGSVFFWLCDAREPVDLAPWAVDLAEKYARRGLAVEDAMRFLDLSADFDPRSAAALGRLREPGAV